MHLSPEAIIKHYPDDGSSLQRVNNRTAPVPLTIVEPNPAWPQRFQETQTRIRSALGATALAIHHTGSTSVPGLPAKDIIDVDLVVPSTSDEDAYVPALSRAGFLFLLREPAWHEHRFFVWERGYLVNLHVFGPDCPEVERHRIFRDWLVKTPEDLELYARVKRECAAAATSAGESMQQYSERKDAVIEEIRNRAFGELGYL